jgi:hypothetical protein
MAKNDNLEDRSTWSLDRKIKVDGPSLDKTVRELQRLAAERQQKGGKR